MENESEILGENINAKVKKEKRKNKIAEGFNSFFVDFKKFISKGNIIDLAVAVVIGAAFNKIVSSFVNDVIMPLISLATGGISVVDWKWIISPATYDTASNVVTAENALTYGVFIQAIIDFLIIALTIFIVLKIIVNSERGMTRLAKKLQKQNKKAQANGGAVEVVVQTPVPVKIESQEDILKDIRVLLEHQVGKTAEEIEEKNKNEQKNEK